MATSLATWFEDVYTCSDPEFDATADPDLADDLAIEDAGIDRRPRGAIGSGQRARYALRGDDFEQQDAHYESASRIALSLVR